MLSFYQAAGKLPILPSEERLLLTLESKKKFLARGEGVSRSIALECKQVPSGKRR